MSVLIVIPARMKATRLPGKPMALIGGLPMIVQVMRRAMESGIGNVIVACDGEEIAAAVHAAGGVAIITDPNHPSGSDRIWEVVSSFTHSTSGKSFARVAEGEPRAAGVSEFEKWAPACAGVNSGAKEAPSNPYEVIINLQGDLPTFEPKLLRDLLAPLHDPAVDITTLAAEITRDEEHENPSVVKAVIALKDNEKSGRALYFTRSTAPANEGPRYHHIGVYAYRYDALKTFVSLPPSPLELREKLEQLRALEAGLRIDVSVVDTVPLGVDTPEDLARARAIIENA
jgi:3-deoxy-manno-octulosonate cytidylyltransferase (CMP-KDO synthetase)